jgi:hypothetical protein
VRAVKLAVAIEQTLPLHGGRAYCLWRQIPDPTLAWAVRSAPPPLCGRLHWQTDPDPTLAGGGGAAGGGGNAETLPLQGGGGAAGGGGNADLTIAGGGGGPLATGGASYICGCCKQGLFDHLWLIVYMHTKNKYHIISYIHICLCPVLDTVSSFGHCVQFWTLCPVFDTVSSFGHCVKFGHCVQFWTPCPVLDAVSSFGHCVQFWTLCPVFDTVSNFGHCVQFWMLCPVLDNSCTETLQACLSK